MTTYEDLINKKGTIYNKTTGQGYQNPEQLAGDLGIQSPQIDWGKITSESLTPVPPLDLPEKKQEPDYTAIMSSLPTIDSIMNTQPTGAEQQQDDISAKILEIEQALTGKSAAQIQAEKTANLPQYQSQLTDINSQIQALQKETLAQNLQAEKNISGGQNLTAGATSFLNKQQQEINRQSSIKALGLSAIAQTLQGNIAMAQAQANRAVEVEFGPKEAQLQYLSKALEINMNKLSREDQKKAQAQQALLKERERMLADEKENKQIIYGWAAEASKNGAPAVLINQALNTTNPQQALSILNQYFQNPLEKEAALADLEYKRAQTSGLKSSAELNKLKTEADIAATKSQTSLAWAKFQADQASGASIKTEITDNGKGGKMLINSQTGEVIRDYGVDPVTGQAVNPANELKTNALTSAQELLRKFTSGEGTSAVGTSRMFGLQLIPGTAPKNFEVQFDNLKSLLSLDNVKYLKGQGQVSDAERRLLAEASAKLNLSQSEGEFKKALEDIIKSLGGSGEDSYTANGKTYVKGADGLYYEK